MTTIADFSDEPKYTIKAVSAQTGVRTVTIRAWERRYDLLSPYRSENRYRLYSEKDVALLRWIKQRVDSGLSISSAVNELHAMLEVDEWPEAIPSLQQVTGVHKATPPDQFAQDLYQALNHHNESLASETLSEAHAIFDLTAICLDIITPCLVEIGEAWYRGEIRITTEHFASNYLRGKLLTLLQAFPIRRGTPYLLIGCAPSEQHEIGSLMLAVLLRREGYRVEYLGPDIPIEDLVEYARYEHPSMIILSSTTEDSVNELGRVQEKLNSIRPTPIFGYGGRVFNKKPEYRQRIAGSFLGSDLSEAIQNVHKLTS